MTVVDDLSFSIENWIKEKSGRSYGSLSRLSRVSESTISRIANKSTKDVDLRNAIALALTTMPGHEGLTIIAKHYPDVANWLDVAVSRGNPAPAEMNQYLESPEYVLILMLCDNRSGTSREDIQKNLGLYGLNHLNTLIESGLVIEQNERYFSTEKLVSLVNQVTLTRLIQSFISLYREENSMIPKTAVKVGIFRSLTLQGIHAAYEAAREFENRLVTIVSNDEYHGDIPFFSGLVQNTLTGASK